MSAIQEINAFIPWDSLAFDHAKVLQDHIKWRQGTKELSMVSP